MTRTELVAKALRETATEMEHAANEGMPASPRTQRAIAKGLREFAAMLDKVTAPSGLRLWWQNRGASAAGRSTSG